MRCQLYGEERCRIRGIDVSENNGVIDWDAVVADGVEFAIVRLGYGNRHLDSQFYTNINEARNRGLKVGVYYYSYALDTDRAKAEGEFVVEILQGCNFIPDVAVWFDMERYRFHEGIPI